MVRNRDSLIPIGDAVSGLEDGSVNELRKALPQARRYFTLADQVNLLVGASLDPAPLDPGDSTGGHASTAGPIRARKP